MPAWEKQLQSNILKCGFSSEMERSTDIAEPLFDTGDSCKHWVKYCDAMETRDQWAKKLVNEFQSKMEKHVEEISSSFSRTAGGESLFKKRPGNRGIK